MFHPSHLLPHVILGWFSAQKLSVHLPRRRVTLPRVFVRSDNRGAIASKNLDDCSDDVSFMINYSALVVI